MTGFSPIWIAQKEMGSLKHGYQVGDLGDLHLHGPRLGNRTINIFMGGGDCFGTSSRWNWGSFFGAAGGSFLGTTLSFLKVGIMSRFFGGGSAGNGQSNWWNIGNRYQYGLNGNLSGYGYNNGGFLGTISTGNRVSGVPSMLNGDIFTGSSTVQGGNTQSQTQGTNGSQNTGSTPGTVAQSADNGAGSGNGAGSATQITKEQLITALRTSGAKAIGTHSGNIDIEGTVQLGNGEATNNHNNETSKDGWPLVFTVTDKRSNENGNKYVFQFVKVNTDGKPVYKVLDEDTTNDNIVIAENKGALGHSNVSGTYDFNAQNDFIIDSIGEDGTINMHTENDDATSKKTKQ